MQLSWPGFPTQIFLLSSEVRQLPYASHPHADTDSHLPHHNPWWHFWFTHMTHIIFVQQAILNDPDLLFPLKSGLFPAFRLKPAPDTLI